VQWLFTRIKRKGKKILKGGRWVGLMAVREEFIETSGFRIASGMVQETMALHGLFSRTGI